MWRAMSSIRPALAVSLALGLLTMAGWGTPVSVLLDSLGVPEETAELARPLVSIGAGAIGLGLLVVGLLQLFRTSVHVAAGEPYAAALRSFAAEFGRAVTRADDHLRLDLQRETQRVVVVLELAAPGRIRVESPIPARQALGWVRQGSARPEGALSWKPVEAIDGVEFLAELPAMARPMLSDAPTVAVVRRLFEYADVEHACHGLGGIVVTGRLPPVEQAQGLVRQAVEVAFRLRRVNG